MRQRSRLEIEAGGYAHARGDKSLYAQRVAVTAEMVEIARGYREAQEPIIELTPEMELDEHDMTISDYAIPGRKLEEGEYQERTRIFGEPQLTAGYDLLRGEPVGNDDFKAPQLSIVDEEEVDRIFDNLFDYQPQQKSPVTQVLPRPGYDALAA